MLEGKCRGVGGVRDDFLCWCRAGSLKMSHITSPLLNAKLARLALRPIPRNLEMSFATVNAAFKLVGVEAVTPVLYTAGRPDTNEPKASNSN